MTTTHAFGIDLGTTHCVAAAMNAWGHTEILRNPTGDALIPSVVLFDDGRTIVGREAQLRGRRHPDRLVACGKRALGQNAYSELVGGKAIPPEVTQACLLRELMLRCLGAAGSTTPVVVAVPAHFNETQRHATATAAEIAGLPLLELVNEPVAAALAFSERTSYLSQAGAPAEPGHVLVFDLGGYAFEATLLFVASGEMTMLGTDHDPALGGYDWNLRLADLLAETFIRTHGLDPRERPDHLEQLVEQAMQMKHALGVRSHTATRLVFDNKQQTVKLTREEFEHTTGDLVQRAADLCDKLLERTGFAWHNLQRVLLVGGASRMPMIREFLTRRLGGPPDDRVCPDEAVARGAAIYAARSKFGSGTPPLLRVTSTSTHSLGIQGVNQETGKKVNKVLIPKGTPLPAKVSHEFLTKSNSKHTIAFSVLEGESRFPDQCVTVGRVVLRELPADVAGQWPVDVTYEYSASGRLSVDAQVRYTDCRVHLETVRPAGVSQAHIKRWREVVMAQAGFPAYRDVLAWIRAAENLPPVIVGAPPTEEAADTTESENVVVLAYLRRMMPFLFGRSRTRDAAAGEPGTSSPEPSHEPGQTAPLS